MNPFEQNVSLCHIYWKLDKTCQCMIGKHFCFHIRSAIRQQYRYIYRLIPIVKCLIVLNISFQTCKGDRMLEGVGLNARYPFLYIYSYILDLFLSRHLKWFH